MRRPPPDPLLDTLGVTRLGDPAPGPDGWREQPVRFDAAAEDASAHLGVVAGVLASLPEASADLTSVALHLEETIPTGEPVLVRTRRSVGGHHDAEVLLHDRRVADGEVEIAGRDPTPRLSDLIELAMAPFGREEPDHRCDVFEVPLGLNRAASWRDRERVAIPWIVEDLLDDGTGRAHPLGVAFLECVARIAAGTPLGASTRSLHLRFFADLPVLEPIRVVGRGDETPRDDTWRGRAAAIDEDGVVYVMASVEARRFTS